jgi:hypothetical protein
VGNVAAAEATWTSGLWSSHPELALALCIAVGAALTSPWRWWAAPGVAVTVALVGLGFHWLQWPSVIGASAAAGALVSWTLPWRTDWLDAFNGALATLTGSVIGLTLSTSWFIPGMTGAAGVGLAVGLTALGGSLGLLPLVLRFDRHPRLPTLRQIQRTLRLPYRPPAFRALDLFGSCRKQMADADTRRGLAEVATWVYRLQMTLQTLDIELEAIDERSILERIETCEAIEEGEDSFTVERRQATAKHLRRLLEHRAAMGVERRRTEALADYALAFLEEARAGLAVARALPGEEIPDRLVEVLGKLRSQAQDGDVRRRTARELDRLQADSA